MDSLVLATRRRLNVLLLLLVGVTSGYTIGGIKRKGKRLEGDVYRKGKYSVGKTTCHKISVWEENECRRKVSEKEK